MSRLNSGVLENASSNQADDDEQLIERTLEGMNDELPAGQERFGFTSDITSTRVSEEQTGLSHEEVAFDSSSDDVFEGLSDIGSDQDDAESADFESGDDEPETGKLDQNLPGVTTDQSVENSTDAVRQKQCVEELRRWVETEAEFYGRTDDDFLVMFLLGCKMNVDKTKTKMTKYYQNRKKVPQWWANRNINDLEDLLQKRMCVLLTDTDPHFPSIGIIKYGRFGDDPKEIDRIMMLHTTLMDLNIRRSNGRNNGVHGIIDCLDYPLWLVTKMLNPVFLYNIALFLLSVPIRIKGVHFLNFPAIGRAVWKLCKPLYPKKIRNRFTFSGSDWTAMYEKVGLRLLPIEYGGTNGSLVDHENAFIEEVHSFSDFFLDDNKYGFQ